ncbi:hypothetical protein ACFYXM_27160 [Streptomyces sp. NPDC002476]|uniref:hypothetical protein n=1 Tax=Streptomyces sp. NPDC002476 TaxID=3364648 RepID=UPI0036D1EC82
MQAEAHAGTPLPFDTSVLAALFDGAAAGIALDDTDLRYVFAKDYRDRRLPMRHEPHETAVDVYRLRQERDGGDRTVAGAPTDR